MIGTGAEQFYPNCVSELQHIANLNFSAGQPAAS
jgi:hypothetical protein